MIKTPILASIILVLSLIWYGNAVLSTAVAQEPIPHAPHRVSIEFSERMPPLDPVLYPGNIFDKRATTALLKKKEIPITWAKIPKWQAGEWNDTHDTITRIVKYNKGKPISDETTIEVEVNRDTFSLGTELDRKADVWEAYGNGGWGISDLGDSKLYSYNNFIAPGNSDHPGYPEYEESTDFKVDKNTSVILTVKQSKTWRRYVCVTPGIMKQETICTHYDEHGEPVVTGWSTNLCRRLLSFDPSWGKSQYKEFSIYLKNNGLQDLIPTTKSAPGTKVSTKKASYKHCRQALDWYQQEESL